MSKMSDFLKKAADKKKGIHHPEGADAPAVEKKVNKATAPKVNSPNLEEMRKATKWGQTLKK